MFAVQGGARGSAVLEQQVPVLAFGYADGLVHRAEEAGALAGRGGLGALAAQLVQQPVGGPVRDHQVQVQAQLSAQLGQGDGEAAARVLGEPQPGEPAEATAAHNRAYAVRDLTDP